MKPLGELFLEQTWSRGLGVDIKKSMRRPRGREARLPGAPRPSWAPRSSTDLLLPPIYIHIPRKHPGAPQNPIFTAATFCTQEIPSWGLFRSSAGGCIDHGGPLHQLHGPSDDVWVVYFRPSGPLLVARWLLLSLWISIQSSPRFSWRSIRCNSSFCGVFVEIQWIVGLWSRLSMNNIWIFSEFFYVWLVYLCKSLRIITLVWPTRLIFLAMGEVLSFGFNLAVSFPSDSGAARHVLYCCHRG